MDILLTLFCINIFSIEGNNWLKLQFIRTWQTKHIKLTHLPLININFLIIFGLIFYLVSSLKFWHFQLLTLSVSDIFQLCHFRSLSSFYFFWHLSVFDTSSFWQFFVSELGYACISITHASSILPFMTGALLCRKTTSN